ncbi:hypothetical protein [Methanofollis fontis]|uniref:Uncharacterized protein n=1 Tax=Methanofollis fontis TaxID=2052832 RepID=A0A483CVJ6_9EURY|nr:hypothetical protein [Methanofollis fontis]TAJ45531.1 hypothetical protein CUJ86_02050 [Methanofollis fontis]
MGDLCRALRTRPHAVLPDLKHLCLTGIAAKDRDVYALRPIGSAIVRRMADFAGVEGVTDEMIEAWNTIRSLGRSGIPIQILHFLVGGDQTPDGLAHLTGTSHSTLRPRIRALSAMGLLEHQNRTLRITGKGMEALAAANDLAGTLEFCVRRPAFFRENRLDGLPEGALLGIRHFSDGAYRPGIPALQAWLELEADHPLASPSCIRYITDSIPGNTVGRILQTVEEGGADVRMILSRQAAGVLASEGSLPRNLSVHVADLPPGADLGFTDGATAFQGLFSVGEPARQWGEQVYGHCLEGAGPLE